MFEAGLLWTQLAVGGGENHLGWDQQTIPLLPLRSRSPHRAPKLRQLANAIRAWAMDEVEQANSGKPAWDLRVIGDDVVLISSVDEC